MSLKEQARAIQGIAHEAEQICYRISHLCELVLTEHKINGDTIQYSQEDQQKIIQQYETEKTRLRAKVDELP